jgi:hypothetical protein
VLCDGRSRDLQPFDGLMHKLSVVSKGAVSAVRTVYKAASPMLNTAMKMAKKTASVAKKVSRAATQQTHKLDNGLKEMQRYAACCTMLVSLKISSTKFSILTKVT